MNIGGTYIMCVFCEIIAGNIPSRKVYEDEHVLAIMDINPLSAGHTLVMPKKHTDDFITADTETVHQVIDVTHTLAERIVKALGAQGVNIVTNVGEAAGQSVSHLHFHIIPRYGNDTAISFHEAETPVDLDEVFTRITA